MVGFLGAVAGCEAVGALGALVTLPAVADWLPTLDQPRFQPPDWVFGPVWSALYALIGISWRLTRRTQPGADRRSAERWLAAQLVLNGLWSYVFFGRRRIGWALIDSAALAIAVGISVNRVRRVSRLAAVLLMPYLGWVVFATALNASLWRRNATGR
ncbi:MAG: TspO/MBR family protein [Acidimicrobiales bacterium]